MYPRKQWQYLYLILQFLHFLSLCPNLHLILRLPSESLLIRFDNDFAINLAISINYNMSDISFIVSSPFLSILTTSFSSGTRKQEIFFNAFC